MSEITVTLNLRVTSRGALLNAAHAAMLGYDDEEALTSNLREMSNEELAEIVIADRVGPWFTIGLEVLDD